ncbi:alpha-2,3-sialyltransferase [Hirschia litorea]|uniref:Alpha-2,3-sialyltransferase n=1 Tax=Hirschia litorea TaxID=1199156 RepID=A0ABW2IPU6_9PROT
MVHLSQRLFTNPYNHAAELLKRFEHRLDDPCYIVGNGPSVGSFTDFEDNAVFFRMNWFFLEEKPIFGRNVDAFFFSAQDEYLISHLETVIEENTYNIENILSPLKCLNVPQNWPKMFDHWTVLATNQAISRYMMSRPLPTQGFQALAFALLAGFKEIRLVGFDLYQGRDRRYAYNIPDDLRRSMKSKDVKAGYEQDHNLDIDLGFLDCLLNAYPYNRISLVSGADILKKTFEGRTATQVPQDKTVLTLSEGIDASLQHTEKAYVTFVDGDYYFGAWALARSLAEFSDKTLYVMHTTPTLARRFDAHPNIRTIQVSPLNNPNRRMDSERFKNTYTKLRVFECFQNYKKICFIDADTIVLNYIDDVFNVEGFGACPDWGLERNDKNFNSGLFVFSPSKSLCDKVMTGVSTVTSSDGGDQGMLNELITDWVPLHPKYNTLKRVRENYPLHFNLSNIHVLHYVGDKPWRMLESDAGYLDVESKWLEYLSIEELRELVETIRAGDLLKAPGRSLKPKESFRRIVAGLKKWGTMFKQDPQRAIMYIFRGSVVFWDLARKKEPRK